MPVRGHRMWAVFVACTVLGIFGLVASPTPAHEPDDVNDQYPGDKGSGHDDLEAPPTAHKDGGADVAGDDSDEAKVLSDDSVGVGGSAVLRGTAQPTEAVFGFAQWYDCLENDTPSMAGDACTHVAVDTTADAIPLPTGFAPADDGVAFTAFWDIPQASDAALQITADGGLGRQFHFAPCLADGRQGGVPFDDPHCERTSAAPVHVDNASAGHQATTAGRIHQIVTAAGTFVAGAAFDTNGAGLKNNEDVTLIAFTSQASPGVDALHACIDTGIVDVDDDNNDTPDGRGTGCDINEVDEDPTPGGGSACHAAAPAVSGADCWSILLDELPTDDLISILIVEYDDQDAGGAEESGDGDCAGDSFSNSGDDCILDEIVVSTTAQGESPGVQPPVPPPPPPVAGCTGKRVNGNARPNVLRGTCGPDKIFGKANNDRLLGKAANDLLNGGADFDRCTGGPGRDRFAKCEAKKQ
jgi:Ca2+-binding RTX toxin-like protein